MIKQETKQEAILRLAKEYHSLDPNNEVGEDMTLEEMEDLDVMGEVFELLKTWDTGYIFGN